MTHWESSCFLHSNPRIHGVGSPGCRRGMHSSGGYVKDPTRLQVRAAAKALGLLVPWDQEAKEERPSLEG